MATAGLLDGTIHYIYPKKLLFSISIAIFSYCRGSLQLSGAVTATLIGYLTLANPNYIFGSALLTFFSIGTIATKYKKNYKSSLVDEREILTFNHQHNTEKQQVETLGNQHGGRDAKQVLCNSWFGTICAIVYSTILRSDQYTWKNDNLDQLLLQKVLVSAALAYWAGCAGDTLSSELGILSRSKPKLITNLREVPPGTNGAVSLLGLVFSTLGGILVGVVSCMTGEPHQSKRQVIISCGVFGLLCSVIDSILGATIQQTLYSKAERRVITRKKVTQLGGSREILIVCGYDWLTNNQVNLISSTVVGMLAGLLSYYSVVM